MSLSKRLRVLWAALTQDWHRETCETCGDAWWVDRRSVPSGVECVTCEDKRFDQWVKQYKQRHQTTKEVA